MPNYVNVLDAITVTVLNGGSQYLTDEDIWFWDYHLSKPHVYGNIAYTPRYCLNEIDPTFQEVNMSSIQENLLSPSNYYYMTPDYTKGSFILSKTTKNLYYLDVPLNTVTELPKAGTLFTSVESTQNMGKLIDFRPATNWLFYANTVDQVLYKYDVSGTIWSALSSFPTGWNINSEIDKEVTVLVDQVTNDLYIMMRNLYVVSATNRTIYYNYRVFKFDLTANVWNEVIHETSFDLYNYGINSAENPHTPGRCMIHNGKLFIFNFFTEVFPTGAVGRDLYLSFIVVNLSNAAVEKNDWIPIYIQSQSCNASMQAVRYGNYMALLTPACPNSCILIDPTTQNISYLRLALGTAQGTNIIRTGTNYALTAVPSSNMLYDPRERKTYSLSWSQGELVVDYSFNDQIFTDSIQFNINNSSGITIYTDVGTGTYTSATTTYNAQSQVLTAQVSTYLKRFRITYTIGSGNADARLYKIQVLGDPTHVWVLNAMENRLDNDQFNNIVVGTPTASRMYKVQNKTGYTTTAVLIFIEANGDTGSYFTQISSASDIGFVGHCTNNTGTTCSAGFNYGTQSCASGRCGGYQVALLHPTPQALPPNAEALFYVRVNVPSGQTRINRQARIICQLEY